LKDNINAKSNHAARAQKLETWAKLARARGFTDPFLLSQELREQVTACLKGAGYRSIPGYISLAKAEFVRTHLRDKPFPEAITLSIKEINRSVKRGLGAAKHTKDLPFLRLAELHDHNFTSGNDGPTHPLQALIFACWWLMREIEVADLQCSHVTFRQTGDSLFVDVYLRVQKNDPQGTGCTRTHTCTCKLTPQCLCPYHVALFQMQVALDMGKGNPSSPFFPTMAGHTFAKTGFIKAVHSICEALNVDIYGPNGAPLITGHVARATGAVFLAENGVELWRIQLLGRWGSEAIKIYIRDAPVKSMSAVALEAFIQKDIHELVHDLKRVQKAVARDQISHPSIIPSLSSTEVRESNLAQGLPTLPQDGDDLVLNLIADNGPKLHAVNASLPDRSRCGWRFALTDKSTHKLTNSADDGNLCLRCFNLRNSSSKTRPEDSESKADSDSLSHSSSNSD